MVSAKPFIIAAVGFVIVIAITLPIILTLPKVSNTRLDLIRVTVQEGNVVGKVTSEAGIFYGIPFSQSPADEYRWRKPRDPLKYDTSYWNATYKRPGCIQICDQPASEYSCPHEINEDCLYLNVWIPSRFVAKAKGNDVIAQDHYEINNELLSGNKRLAVMVWFYGGNFLNGAGSCTLYDGRFMAEGGDVIVVTTNYRVAHFGFLVQGTDPEENKGNFGFWDQVKALQWVNTNIRHFGGDPGQVTIFGQSAGAESIGIHLTSSVSEHLFQQSIMQSNPFGLPLRNLTDAQQFGNLFAEAANCMINDMKCLRSRSIEQLEKAFNDTALKVTDPSLITLVFQPWSPVIDWDVVPDQPIDLFMQGKEQKKPMIIGATVDEGMIFVAEAFPNPMTSTVYNALLLAVFKHDYNAVVTKYPPQCTGTTDCDNRDMVNHLATEYLFQCPQRNAMNSTDNNDRWWYMFNQTWSFKEVWEEPLCYDKVCHAAELAYLFNVESLTSFEFTEEERLFSKRLMWYWTNFAKHGDPNVGKDENAVSDVGLEAIEWPSFDETAPNSYEALHISADGDYTLKEPYNEICDFWDNIDAYADHYMSADAINQL